MIKICYIYAETNSKLKDKLVHFFLFLFVAPLGGVTGLPAFMLYWNFLLSAGFNIWKLHINVSSTDIIAPALSNSPKMPK